MGYIDRNLIPGETVLFRTKKSRIIFFYPMILLIFSFFAFDYMLTYPMLKSLSFAPWLVSALIWAYVGLEYVTSEYAVTTKRVMMREGFFNRHANEMRLSAISQVNVDQSLLGQILNYGVVTINAFGAYDAYPLIAYPGKFQKVVNEQIDKVIERKA